MKFYRLKEYCNYIIQENLVENLAIKVGKWDEVFFENYYSKTAIISEQTLFDMASVSKILCTTSLALIAIDKGILSVRDSVSKFFDLPEEKAELTIYHLLTHTIGMGHKGLNIPGVTRQNVAEFILGIPNDIPIGSNVLYSCPGFILLGFILEKVFGETLDKAFQRFVTEPLNMTHTTFGTTSMDVVNSNAKLHERGLVNDYNCRYLGGVCGNAGVFSNMHDMTKYAKMLLQRGKPLFSQATFDKAVQNYTSGMNEARGLGFLYIDDNYAQTAGLFESGAIGHCGHTGQSIFVDYRSGLYVIVLSDATISTIRRYGKEDYSKVMQMRHDLHHAIMEDL